MQKRIFLSIIFIGIAIDMTSKRIAEMLLHHPQPIVGDLLQLRLSYNTGMAFSLPIPLTLLQVLTIIIIFATFVHYSNTERWKKDHILDIGYALLLSGAISHGFERIVIGHVVDFIAVQHFAVFNIADMLISAGIFLIILAYAGSPKKLQ